jgi:hypothetical protein
VNKTAAELTALLHQKISEVQMTQPSHGQAFINMGAGPVRSV